MVKNRYFNILVFVFSMVLMTSANAAVSFNNSDWNRVLDRYVDDQGFVDYSALAANRDDFDRYITAIKNNGPSSTPALFPNKNDQLAYYINAYNALVFEGVLNRGPEQKSVWRGLISGLNFFVRMKIMVDGQQTNLKNLEDDIIRERFMDPRIHAAINCASISCPRLPRQAFEAQQLDQQLDAAMREFVAKASNVSVDVNKRTVYLSKIFDWFKEDFIDYETAQGNPQPNLISYVNRYRTAENQLPADYSVKFFKYNKGINKQG